LEKTFEKLKMLVKFFPHPKKRNESPKSNPKLSMKYLLDKPDGKIQILSGDPEIAVELSENLLFANQYTAGCLAFEEANIPQNQKYALIQQFEATFLAGLEANQYYICWIEHTDKDRLKLNFFIPTIELSTGKRLQPYYHRADREMANNFTRAMNLHYGFSAPDAPQKRQTLILSNNLPQQVKDTLTALNGLIEHEFTQGTIQNRQDVINCFVHHSFEIEEQSKNSILIKNENDRDLRLKGAFYEQTFRADQARRAITEAERGTDRENHQRAIEHARERLQQSIRAKFQENRKRFTSPRCKDNPKAS